MITLLAYRGVLWAPFIYEDRMSLGTLGLAPGFTVWALLGRITRAPWAFHALNVAVHLVNGWLLFLIARSVWGAKVALLAMAIFLLHPLQTESVAYVTGNSELLSATWLLLAVLIGVTAIADVGLAALLILECLGFAVWTKPAAMVTVGLVPFALFLSGKRACLPALCIGMGALAVLGLSHAQAILSQPDVFQSEFTPAQYAGQQAVALWRLLGLCVWPVGLSIDHDFGVASPSLCAIAASAFVGVLLFAVKYAFTTYGVLVGWIVLAMWPRFAVRSVELMHEHHFYLSMIGVSVATAYLIAPYLESVPCDEPAFS